MESQFTLSELSVWNGCLDDRLTLGFEGEKELEDCCFF